METTAAKPGQGVYEEQTGGALAKREDLAGTLDRVFSMPEEHRKAVAEYIGCDPNDPGMPAFLAVSHQLGLNPFLGEIWLIETEEKKKVTDADGRERQEKKKRKRPAVGRDGLLSHAQKTGVLRGVQFDVVCANDHFEVDWGVAPEEAPRIIHRQAPLTPDTTPDDPYKYRGAILGAWCKVTRADGAYPTYYFAPLREHAKTWSSGDGRSGYSRAWVYTSAMIVKSAVSYALRIAFSVTGIVPVDELRDPNRPELTEGGPNTKDFEDVPWGPDPELAERLKAAVLEANAIEANRWSPATLQMMLGGRSVEELGKIADEIETENERHHAEQEAKVEDADVVEEPEAAEEPQESVHQPPEPGPEPEVVDAEPVEEEPEEGSEVEAIRTAIADLRAKLHALQEAGGDPERETELEIEIKQHEDTLRLHTAEAESQEEEPPAEPEES